MVRYNRKRPRRTRRSAATTLQRAWRRKMRRKRGSVVQRQALANKRAIAVLKKAPEIKRSDGFIATPDTNYSGMVLKQTIIDNYGFPQSTALWNSTSSGGYLPTPSLYQPVAMCPMITQQGVDAVGGDRIGDDVKNSSIIAKVRVYGGDATKNGSRWLNAPALQKVRCVALLDEMPVPENTSLASTPSAFQFSAMGFQFFSYSSTWNPLLPAGTSVKQNVGLDDTLYGILQATANPAGLATNAVGLAQRFLPAQGYRDSDVLDKKRFKILQVKDVSVSQMPNHNTNGTDRPFNCVKNYTIVLKQPWKFHYDSKKSLLPSNRRVYLCFFSDCATQRGSPTTPATDYLDPPSVSVSARFNYTDA